MFHLVGILLILPGIWLATAVRGRTSRLAMRLMRAVGRMTRLVVG